MNLSCTVWAEWWSIRWIGPPRWHTCGGAGEAVGDLRPHVARDQSRGHRHARPPENPGPIAPHASSPSRPGSRVKCRGHSPRVDLVSPRCDHRRASLPSIRPGVVRPTGRRSVGVAVGPDDPLLLALEVLHEVERVLLGLGGPELAAELALDPAQEVELRVVGLDRPGRPAPRSPRSSPAGRRARGSPG